MPEPTIYEIVLRGRAGARLLRPLLDDFALDYPGDDTRLVGTIRDAAHLHGVVIHLTSVKTELISIAPMATLASSRNANPNPTARRAPEPKEQP